MVGVFGRVVYSWKSRYTVTGNLRFDGSSRFGKNNRWGSFPSVSAAWRISDEPFMRWANNILTDAKSVPAMVLLVMIKLDAMNRKPFIRPVPNIIIQ